jgi:hypothetical protein
VQVQARLDPSPYRRSGFEVASWDGTRWTLEAIYDSGAEAAQVARRLLEKRLGVKVMEEIFAEDEGVFKSRIVLAEYRDGVTRPRKPTAPGTTRPQRVFIQAGNDNAMMVAISALAISVASLLLAMMR